MHTGRAARCTRKSDALHRAGSSRSTTNCSTAAGDAQGCSLNALVKVTLAGRDDRWSALEIGDRCRAPLPSSDLSDTPGQVRGGGGSRGGQAQGESASAPSRAAHRREGCVCPHGARRLGGADVNYASEVGETALHLSRIKHSTDVAKAMVMQGRTCPSTSGLVVQG